MLYWTVVEWEDARIRNLDKTEDLENDPIRIVQPIFEQLHKRVIFYTLLAKLCRVNETENPLRDKDQMVTNEVYEEFRALRKEWRAHKKKENNKITKESFSLLNELKSGTAKLSEC